ncbi:5-formyltetrahydrofolate cyclo-ligase [Bacillus sp. AFS015802]|uniref:5-formyltetrahydrofolate cyclo-ligase n=1 Tax=Bacillus sp. AFS015802 TaxID=2033486 RepID=UPI000BF572A9|nr:5-formyltetrahydrofolate cyclo-ligase [Bacillus sp. AFS015802]PFA62387.1 5-formyltetrahydrofolate cyclo-ligase [Bacillus sp. AFS015802]
MSKKERRKSQLQALKSIDHIAFQQKCFEIEQRLFHSPEWKGSRTIAITVSNPPEVNTWNIIKRGWEEGKTVVVPKCLPQKRQLIFYELCDFQQLEQSYFNLYEPDSEKTTTVRNDCIELMIVPGLAYTIRGYRLGFGGGYYDRLLSAFSGTVLSLAFEEQIVDSLPIESFDMRVSTILTEKRRINCDH